MTLEYNYVIYRGHAGSMIVGIKMDYLCCQLKYSGERPQYQQEAQET